MKRLAVCTLTAFLSFGLHAQEPASRSSSGETHLKRSELLGHVAVGPAATGLTGIVELGPNAGQFAPQAFGLVAVPTSGRGRIGLGTVEERFRAALGVVSRVSVASPLESLDVAASIGGGFSATRGIAIASDSPGEGLDPDRVQSLWRRGAVGILGLEATQWITPRVGLSVSVHQMVRLPLFRHTDEERYRTEPPFPGGPVSYTAFAPSLEHTAVGFGLRIGRQ